MTGRVRYASLSILRGLVGSRSHSLLHDDWEGEIR